MFYQVFFSQQVKRCTVVTYKHGINEATRVADRRKTEDLRKLGNIRKVSKIHGMTA